MKKLVRLSREYSIRTWFDRRSRSWITQYLDDSGNEIRSAYNGTREGAQASIDEFKLEHEKGGKR